MALAPGDILRLKQGSTFPWQKQLVTVLADGTVTPLDLTGKTVKIKMTHARSGAVVLNGTSAAADVTITDVALGKIAFTLTPTILNLVGAHQVTWDVNGTPYPFENYDVVEVEGALPSA